VCQRYRKPKDFDEIPNDPVPPGAGLGHSQRSNGVAFHKIVLHDFIQDRYFLKIKLALVPPKPKELDMAVEMFCFLATFGT